MVAIATASVFGVSPVEAYEFATHAALTREAYRFSRLNPEQLYSPASGSLIVALGLDRRDGDLGFVYIDLAATGPKVRVALPLDNRQFGERKIDDANKESGFARKLPSLAGWLMLGAIREDDVPYDAGEVENTPQDDPAGAFVRVMHHFHDPYFDRPLVVGAGPTPNRAVDWAIAGAAGGAGRANNFSVASAREAMWRALTLKERPPASASTGPLADLVFAPSTEIPTRESLRVAYWATTFRALGDVVHLLQDMAQPQHTRNDPHAGLGCIGQNCALGHKSYYETYVEARVKGAHAFSLRERFFSTFGIKNVDEEVKVAPPKFDGYDPVRLGSYALYFATATGSASTGGAGLGNYSNRGFFSAGTVPGAIADPAERYPLPDPVALVPATISGNELVNAAGKPIGRGALLQLKGPVVDNLRPENSEAGVPLVSYGVFDQFLREKGKGGYVLTHYNYAEQARLLLPRAVAYSAGLIDYFFRGMLEIGLPDEGVYAATDNSAAICKDTCGFDRVKLKLTNATPGEAMGPGVAVAVVKYHRNTCYRSDLTGDPGGPNFAGNGCRNAEEEIVVSDAAAIAALPAGATLPLKFDFTQRKIPINATDVTLQLVYRGKLGQEDDAVAVTSRNVAEPSYVALENATDYRFSTTTGSYAPSGAPVAFAGATVTFAAAGKPLATAATVPAPGYAQLAFLGERAATAVKVDFAAAVLSGGHPLTVALPAFEFYLPAGPATNYGSTWAVAPVRGLYRRFVYSVARAANYEVYQCAPDFNPLACTEATLPPLTAANAVPWVVDFK